MGYWPYCRPWAPFSGPTRILFLKPIIFRGVSAFRGAKLCISNPRWKPSKVSTRVASWAHPTMQINLWEYQHLLGRNLRVTKSLLPSMRCDETTPLAKPLALIRLKVGQPYNSRSTKLILRPGKRPRKLQPELGLNAKLNDQSEQCQIELPGDQLLEPVEHHLSLESRSATPTASHVRKPH